MSAVINKWALRVANLIPSSDLLVLMLPREKQDKLLAALKAAYPKPSLVDRSYMQYLCQRPSIPVLNFALVQVFSGLILLPFYVYCLFAGTFSPARRVLPSQRRPSAILFHPIRANVGASLEREFEILNSTSTLALNWNDLWFLFKTTILPHPLNPYFALKCAMKIAGYRSQVQSGVSAFIVSTEYSFASSIATMWCRGQGIQHINIQHGLSVFNVRDAFAAFDRFYCWSKTFEDLYSRLGIIADYRVESPPALDVTKILEYKTSGQSVLKYYLQINTNEDLVLLARFLTPLANEYRVVVRPHPIYTDQSRLRDIFSDIEIESTSVPIFQSIGESDLVVSRHSAVLYQAAIAGKVAVIDDVTDQRFFEHLKHLEFAVFSMKHKLLSEICKNVGDHSGVVVKGSSEHVEGSVNYRN